MTIPLTDAEVKAKQAREIAESTLEYQKLQQEKADMLTAQNICDSAKIMKAWIYDPENKHWYTPDEFLSKYNLYYKNHPLFKRVQLKNPLEGVEAGFKKLNMIQTKLQAFYERVIAYYAEK